MTIRRVLNSFTNASIPAFCLQDLVIDQNLCLLIVTYLGISTQAQSDKVFCDPILKPNAEQVRKKIAELTPCVISAEQDEKHTEYKVVQMLRSNPDYVDARCSIPLSTGTREMTPLQKAFFSCDQHLWEAIILHMDQQSITQQLQEFVDEKGARHVDLVPFILANLEVDEQVRRHKFYDANIFAVKKMGLAQRNLFMDAANYKHQYCHPTRALQPCPDFANEKEFPRQSLAHSVIAGKREALDEKLLGTDICVTRGANQEIAVAYTEIYKIAEGTKRQTDLTALVTYTNLGIKAANELLKKYGVKCKPAAEIDPDDVELPEKSFWSRCFR